MKKNSLTRFLCLAISLILLVLFVGCTPKSDTSQSGTVPTASSDVTTKPETVTTAPSDVTTKPKRLIFARNEKILTLDEGVSNNISNDVIIRAVYDTLVELDKDGNVLPVLATKWEVNDTATEWVFTLRQDVLFSDGSKLTAEDVKASFMYPVENNLNQSSNFKAIASVEAVDDYTVKINCNTPYGALLSTASSWGIMSHTLVERGGDAIANEMLGSGPWMLKENIPDVHAILVRNPNFWGEPPYYDEIEYVTLLEDSTRLAAIQNGEVDIADNMDPTTFSIIESDKNMILYKLALADQQWLGLKTDKAPFNDKNVREALSLSIDRQAIVDMLKGGKVASGVIPSTSLGGGQQEPYEYNPERAKKLLAESSYDGRELTFLSFTGNYIMTMEQLEAIQAMMTEVGFNVKLDIFDNATFMQRRAAELYDLFWTGSAHRNADPMIFLNGRILANTQKTNYVNEEMFSWIKKGSSDSSVKDRATDYAKVNEIAMKDFAPFLGINETISGYAVSKKVDPASLDIALRPDRVVLFRYLKGVE